MNNYIIEGASYCVYEGGPTKDSSLTHTSGIIGGSKVVTFYTFDGEPIKTIEHKFHFPLIEAKLDPAAPKPKPVSFRKIWWPAFDVGFGLTKGTPGYAVLFHDKNGNRIGWERMKCVNTDIKTLTRFDLSEAYEEPADFSRKR